MNSQCYGKMADASNERPAAVDMKSLHDTDSRVGHTIVSGAPLPVASCQRADNNISDDARTEERGPTLPCG